MQYHRNCQEQEGSDVREVTLAKKFSNICYTSDIKTMTLTFSNLQAEDRQSLSNLGTKNDSTRGILGYF